MCSISQLAADEEAGVYRGAHDPEDLDLDYESSIDQERREHPVYIMMDVERFTTFAFTVAGAATGPLLQDNPNYVFPSERVSERVREVMREFGVEPAH
jgi:hypothetical protein